MTIIVCVELNNGMLFNNRRLSRDENLVRHIIKLLGNRTLWIKNFSKEIFDIEKNNNIIVDDDFLNKIGENDTCFIENIMPDVLEEKADKIILYNWNRRYPADKYFNIDLNEWFLESEEEIEGSSHEKIIQKIYVREN